MPCSAEAASGIDILPPVSGGTTRQASVLAGLEALAAHKPDVVLVHDAARPFVSSALIARAIAAGEKGAGVPALAITDTVKSVENDIVTSTLDRNTLRTIQTPQAFKLQMLLDAHRKAASAGRQLIFPRTTLRLPNGRARVSMCFKATRRTSN